MAGLSFEINVEQEKLDKFISSLEKLKKTIASIPSGTNEFKQIDAQIGALERKIEKSIKKIAEMQKNIGKSVSPTSGGPSLPPVSDEEYRRLIEALKEVVGERANNIQSMINEETAIKILQRELTVIAQKEREAGKLSEGQAKRRVQVVNSIQEHKQALSSLRQVVNNDIKLQQAAETSMESMSQSLGKMRLAYRKLDETTRESQFGKDLLRNIQTTDAKLKELDAAIGNYQRNVGNYASSWNGLQYQMQMVARELPNFAINPQIGILSLTNNIPYLVDELNKARTAYKAYTAAVKAGETDLKAVPSVGKQVLSSLLNWQTAIVAGITLITAYRKEISEWVGSLFKAKKSNENLKTAILELNGQFQSEITILNNLFASLKKAKEGTEEYNNAKLAIQSKYGDILTNLDSEKRLLKDIEGAQRGITAAIKETVSERLKESFLSKAGEESGKEQADALLTIRDRIIKDLGDDAGQKLYESVKEALLTYSGKDEKGLFYSNIVKQMKDAGVKSDAFGYWGEITDAYLKYTKAYNSLNQSIKDAEDIYSNKSKETNVFADINKEIDETSEKIKQLEKEIIDIRSGKNKPKGVSALKAISTREEEINRLKSNLSSLTGERKNNTDNYNAILSQQEKVKDLLAKQARDRIRYEEDMYDEIEQIRINALNDGYKRTIAQMELNHEKELRAIDREKEDLLQKRRDEAKAVFNARQEELAKADKRYRKQTFDEETVSLSDEENTMFDEKYKAQLDVQAKDTKDVWESMLKNYQDYDAKRAAIDKKYNEDVQSLQAEREKAEKAGNAATVVQIDRAIAEAGKKRKEDLSAVTLEEFKTDIDWATLFGNLDVLSSSSLDNLRNKLKEFIEAAASKLTPQDLKTLSDAMTNIDLTLADKSPYDVLKTSLKDYKGATQETAKAQERLNKLQKEGKGGTEEYKAATKELTDAERKRSESLKTMSQATNNIGEKGQQVVQAGSDITDMLTSLGVSVPESISGALDGMGQVMSAMASVDLMKPMSILTGITGTLAGLGKTIGSLFGGKGDKALKDTQRLEQVTNRIAETEKVINSFIEKRIDLIKDATLAEQKSLATTTKQAIDNQKAYYEQLFQGLRGNWILAKKGKNNNLTAEDLGLNSIKDLADFLGSTRLNDLLQNQGFSLRDADKWYELVNSLDNLLNREKELEETTSQGLIGITFDEAKSALDDFVRDSNTKLSDVADNFEDHMRNAMLNMVKQNYLNKALEKWYGDVEKALSDGSLDETETANLKQAYENAYTGAKNMYDAALKAAGISASGSSYTQEASKRGFAAMSQDSADELNGRFTALQIAGESIQQSNSEQVAAMAQIVTEMRSMRETVFQNFRTNEESLQMIANIYLETQGINENTSLMSKSLVSISKDIAEVKKNTNGLARR